MKGKVKRQRCCGTLKIFVVTFVVFALIHTKYLFSLDKRKSVNKYELPDSLKSLQLRMNTSVRAERGGDSISFAKCNPKRGVVFLKTHKTGSTTMNNILLRYAKKHKLSVGLPPPRRWELGGYPAFNEKLIDPQLDQYEMLCHHFRMPADMGRITRLVPHDAVFITILRDPAEAFESGFAFFRDYPFSVWVENYKSPDALARFLDSPARFYNRSTPWYFRAKNYQAYDLGLKHEREDDGYISEALRESEDRFSLVLITDRMDESLVLLKELLCMDSMDDISYIRLKVRQERTRRVSTERMIEQMRRWNRLDSALYNHFLGKLEEKIDAYGRKRMEAAVEELRIRTAELEGKCVLEYDQENMRPWISRIRVRPGTDKLCQELTWGEVKFGDYVRKIQKSYVPIQPDKQVPLENMRMILEREQRKILNI